MEFTTYIILTIIGLVGVFSFYYHLINALNIASKINENE